MFKHFLRILVVERVADDMTRARFQAQFISHSIVPLSLLNIRSGIFPFATPPPWLFCIPTCAFLEPLILVSGNNCRMLVRPWSTAFDQGRTLVGAVGHNFVRFRNRLPDPPGANVGSHNRPDCKLWDASQTTKQPTGRLWFRKRGDT